MATQNEQIRVILKWLLETKILKRKCTWCIAACHYTTLLSQNSSKTFRYIIHTYKQMTCNTLLFLSELTLNHIAAKIKMHQNIQLKGP
jgi:hypothetical protein